MNRKQAIALGILAFLSVLAIGYSGGISADDNYVEIGNWDDLREYIEVEEGIKPIKLVGDPIDAFYGFSPYTIEIRNTPGQHRTVVLDLNGHTINRACEDYEPKFDQKLFAIQNDVTFVIKDSSVEKQGGMIRSWSSGVTSDYCGFGGIIYNDGEVIIEAGMFRSNQAASDGGAIYNAKGATLTIRGGTFSVNFAERNGGAIYNAGTVNIEGGTFAGNVAGNYGGAIYNVGLLNISGGFMYTNEAQFAGGAIYNDDGGRVLITAGNISDNMSLQGSAIYNKSSILWTDDKGRGHYAVDISDADLDKNHAFNDKDTDGDGAAIWNSGYLSLSKATLEDNEAEDKGGAIFNSGIMQISASTFANNKATTGAAIRNDGESARLTILDSTFSGNNAKSGGSIFNATEGEIVEGSLETGAWVSRCTFDGGSVTNSGGAIYNRGAMVVSGSTIRGNSAEGEGGGIFNEGSNLTIMSTHIESNSAEGEGGGAIYIDTGVVYADGLIAEYNKCSQEGGAIYISHGSLYLSNSMIDNNEAVVNAGAILLQASGGLHIEGLIRVIDNKALMSRNILLEEGATIELSGEVNPFSTVDFAMENIYDPVTRLFNSELCNIGVFSYNEASGDGLPFYQKVEDDVSELYVDIDLWNEKLGAILITDWEMLREYMTNDHSDGSGEKLEIALANDIYGNDGDDIYVSEDVILDLNGFTLDRQVAHEYVQDGNVLNVCYNTDLVIKDSIGTGRITGGSAIGGGGIYIEGGSKVTFEGGTVYRNSARNGGGFFVDGELEMTGGGILQNSAKYNGGAILGQYALSVSNATIAYNHANEQGGAMFLDLMIDYRVDDYIFRNCEILYNSTYDGEGGAVYMTCHDTGLHFIDCIINYNWAGDDGGAIYIDEGGISISGNSELCYNSSDGDGGAIYTDERKVVIGGNTKVCYNHADDDGGAIYTEGIIEVDGRVDICYNDADDGGAIYINDGSTVNIRSGTTLSYNTADGNGGAIYVDDDGNINLWGGTITYNSAEKGGGVYMNDDSDDIAVSGDLVVMYNDAIDGNGIYLSEDNHLDIDGPLADTASILVASENGTGKFTKGYSKHNGDKSPSTFFISSEGFLVVLDDGEAKFVANRTGSTGLDDDFIEWESQIVDYYSISDKNWMSGISGDRRLNEINIPGTHDSGMRSTKCHYNASLGDFAHMSQMAQTQALYIDEQLRAGVRILDIRINNQHLVPYDGWNPWAYAVGAMWSTLTWSDGRPYQLEDDGENLWICHGKNSTGGTFYARDHDGDDLSVEQVLDWIKDFLVLHPTETLIVGFSAEVQGDDEDNVAITNDRIIEILSDMYDEINPSTGKPFIYRVGDSPLGTPLTEYPYLKDVRGQIVLYNNPLLGGITSDTIGDVTESYSQDVDFDCSIDDKRQSVYRFFAQHVNEVDLTRDVNTHLTVRHSIGMNVGPTDTMYYIGKYFQSFYDHDIGPMHNAHVLLGEFFVDGGPFDQRGKYVGWVKTDGAKAEHYAYVWKSNFPDDLNYATVTVESGLGGHEKQTYQLLLGTRITLPGCIYGDIGDLVFDGWKVDDTKYASGTEYIVSGDVTFIADWRNTNVYTITFVNYDDTVLEVFHYNEGTSAQDILDKAPSPSKPGDAQYTYSFAGWDPAVTDAVADVTYKAVYSAVLNKYTVTWMTYDGVSVIETDENVDYGSPPSYDGPEQTREETVQHTYKFIGWSEDVDSESGVPVERLPAVTGNVTYYASFIKVIKTVKVTFLNWDDSVYFEATVAMETEPKIFVPVNNPTRPPDDDHYYEFKGWSPEPVMAMEDAVYHAEFKKTTELRYCVKFMDWDATILSEKMYEAGTSFSDIAVPKDPTRSPTTQFSFTFKGWSPEVPTSGELTGDVVFSATYNYIVNQYLIRFVDWDGTLLSEQLYDFGTSGDEIVRPADPMREPDHHYIYDFEGWIPHITDVMTDETYQAVYSEAVRSYIITWKNYDGEVLDTTEVPYGDIPIYYGDVPTRPDSEADTFTFQGWSPGLQFVSGDAEYTATFFGVGLVFSLTYDPNGGRFTDPEHQGHESYQHGYDWPLYNSADYGHGDLVVRDGYVFSWWADSDGNRMDYLPKEAYGDLTLYATWLALPYEIHYQVDMEGHFEHKEYTIESETFTLPHPEVEGYTFVAWTELFVEDPEWLPDVTIEKGSTGSRVFDAHWEPNVYKIEYYDGDTKLDLEPSTYTYGEKNGIAAQPAKEGYTKGGWFTTSDFQEGTQMSHSVPEKTMGDLKLYAKYDVQQGVYWEVYPGALDLVYTSEEQTLISPGTAVGGTAYYKVGNDEYSKSLPKAISSRDYYVDYKIVDSDGNDVDTGWVVATIDKAQSGFIYHPVLKSGPFVFKDEDINPIEEDGVAFGGSTRYSLDGEDFSYTWSSFHLFDAGDYTIYYKSVGDANHSDSEVYTLNVTVEKQKPDVIPPVPNELEYTGEAQVLTSVAYAGSGIVLYSLDQENWSESVPSATDAGEYLVYYRCAEDRNHYGTDPDFVKMEIYPADPSWIVTPCSYDYGYNGNPQPLIILAIPLGGTAMYRLESSEEYSASIPMVAEVGEYTVYYMIAGDSNHNDGAEGSVKATISKGQIKPEVSIENWFVGDAPSVPVVSGNPGGGAVTYEYKAVTAEESAYSGTVPTTVGNYNIRATVAETENYLGGYAVSTFYITKKPLNLTLTMESWTYGEEAKTPTLTGNVGGGEVSIMYKLRSASDVGYVYAVPIDPGLYTVRAVVSETEEYQSATVTADFEIRKCPISPVVTTEGWTYGEEAKTPSVTGNTGGGEVTYQYKLKAASEESYTTDVPVNAGIYMVKAIVAETTYYQSGTATADFEIKKAAISPTVTAEGWTYGEEAKAPSVSGNPGDGAVTFEYKPQTASEEAYTADVPVNAGLYTVKATVAETDNYLGGTATADFEIAKAPISPVVTIEGWTYGEEAKAPSTTGNPGDGAVTYAYKLKEASEESYTADVPVNAGTYTIKATVAETDNYLGGTATADFEIAKAPITPVVTLEGWTYGEEAKAPSTTGNPGDGAVTYAYKLKEASEEAYVADEPVNAGLYTVKATVAETDNYLGGTATADFEIAKAPISPVVTIEGWTYGEEANEPSVSGNPGDGAVTYEYKPQAASEEAYTADVPVNAGLYTVKATVAETDNYLGGTATADFEIAKAPITPVVTLEGWTYGEEANEPSVSGNPGEGEVTYEYKLKEASEEEYTADVPVNAGMYVVKATVAETDNYLGGTATADFEIAKAPITPTVSIEGWTYGKKANVPSVTGNPGEGEVTYEYKLKEASEEAYSVDVPVNAGTYTVRATVAETDNYLGGTATADFEIAKAPISPVVTIEGWTYGKKAKEPTLTGNPGRGAVIYEYKLTDAPDSAYTTAVPTEVGTYTVRATVSETANYLGGTATADFKIKKASLFLEVTIEGWEYVDVPNEPFLSGNLGGGAVLYEYKLQAASEEEYSEDVPVDAGLYTVRATVAETKSYHAGTATADFEISRSTAVVTADSFSKVYGSEDPKFTAVVTGLKAGDPESLIQYTLSRTAGENVGEYEIRISAEPTRNYHVATVTGILEITKKDAIVDADPAFKTEGDKDPELTYKVYGLIPGDTLAGIVLARTAGEAVGLYTVYFASLPVNSNYDITCNEGMFFITSKPTAEEHEDGTVTYTAEDFYRVDENTVISIKTVQTDDKDGNMTSAEYSQSLIITDIDERGNERVTTTTATTVEIVLEDGGRKVIDIDSTEVVAILIDSEGKDILTTVTHSFITDRSTDTITEECIVEDHRMVTEAVYVHGDSHADVTTTILYRGIGDTITEMDLINAERQAAICLEHIGEVSCGDRTVTMHTGERPLITVENGAFGSMAEGHMAFIITSDCGSLRYGPVVAAVFAGYDEPVTLQLLYDTYDSLSTVQKAAVPEGTLVVTVSAVSGKTAISDLGGYATVTFPYVEPEGWSGSNAYCLDLQGALHRDVSGYNGETMHVIIDRNCDIAVLQTYSITVYQQGEGTVTISPSSARAGETVALTAIPAEGFTFSGWEADPEIAITGGAFTMPASDVAILADFKRTGPAPGPAVQSIEVFSKPDKTSYLEGERFEPAGLVLKVSYADGSASQVPYVGNETSFSFDPSIVKPLKRSDSSITVVYGGADCEVGITVKTGNVLVDNALLICCAVIAIVAIAAAAVLIHRRNLRS